MESIADWSLAEWLEALGTRVPTPAGGALALATLAGAAALVAKVTRIAGADPAPFDAWASVFLEGAGQDGEAYLEAVRLGGAEVHRCLALGLDQVELSARFLEALGPLFQALSAELRADVAAAERLARASANTLLVNLAVNLSHWSPQTPGLEPFASALQELRKRLEEA